MIAVVADDLTGAAELGGVARRYGLVSEVQTEFTPDSRADVIAVDTDTRSCTAADAVRRVAHVIERVREARPELVYKKVDSVLRGHVVAEITAVMDVLALANAILVPANPSLGRTIKDGRYLVDGVPVSEQDFTRDPEHPRRSADVLEMLDCADESVACLAAAHAPRPAARIIVGEAADASDLAAWAERLDPETLPAGAADWFAAVLQRAGHHCARRPPTALAPAEGPVLVVCGSASERSRAAVDEWDKQGVPVLDMPVALPAGNVNATEAVAKWARHIVRALKTHRSAIVRVGRGRLLEVERPEKLIAFLARLVESVLQRRRIADLLIEGGATASTLLRRLGWQRMRVRREVAPGVVRMNVLDRRGPRVTLKVGSYPWPDELVASVAAQ